MAVSPPLDWIKRIDEALFKLDEKPQFPLPTSFPMEKVEELFKTLFDHGKLSIKAHSKGWVNAPQIWEGLGKQLCPLKIEMTPLEEPLYFVLSQQDLAELMSDLLGGESASAPFYDASLTSGFYHFLALEILQIIEEAKFGHPLSPRLGEISQDIHQSLKDNSYYLVDLSLELESKTVWGRLIIPASFKKAFSAHFAALPPPPLSERAKQKIVVSLSLAVGYSELSLEEYKSISAGDFLILDRCSYDPLEKKGGVTLLLGETPLFRGKIRPGEVKILEYPRYEEVEMDEEALEGEEVVEETVAVDKLPINLVVEVGRIQMSVSELANLTPGNLLELNIAPEQGVNLIVGGKKVGRGELVRIGETLGVRIITI